MAESSYAWLSVIVKRGPKTLIPRKVIKMEWEKNFGELLTAVDLALANSMIYQVRISSNESFLDPVHEVEVSAPLSVCNLFNCRFVCIYLEDVATISTTTASKLNISFVLEI